MRSRVLPFLLAFAASLACGGVRADAPPPRRIASLNLCTDQLLVALAEPARIASLSPLATDPALSFVASAAKELPRNGGSGEVLFAERPDLVLAGPYDGRARLALLRRFDIPVLTLGPWASLAEGRAQIATLGRALGREEAAGDLVAAIDAALERAAGAAPASRRVLALQRRGYAPGETTILDELLRHMGLEPYSERLGVRGGGMVGLERLVADPPDYLLLAESDRLAEDQGSALLAHPALALAVPPERRLVLPDRLTICGGPSTPAAIDALARLIRERVR